MTIYKPRTSDVFPLPLSAVCTDCMDDGLDAVLERTSHMKSEKNRLNSYRNWPPYSCQSPHHLAKAGFYYTGTDDRVECPFCFGVLKKWKSTDVPLSEHRTHFPYCKFINGEYVGNIPMEEDEKSGVSLVHTSQCANGDFQGATNLIDLTKEENRLRTFSRWPSNLSQTPEILARAGFYHIPDNEKPDRVKCAYCKGKLYNWEFGDDPWLEHARCFASCPYVKLCVGENAIADLQRNQIEVCESVKEKATPSPVSKMQQSDELENAPGLMQSEAVQAVIEMGFASDLVRRAVEKHNNEHGSQVLSGENLASIVLDMEQTGEGNSDICNSVNRALNQSTHRSERLPQTKNEEKLSQKCHNSELKSSLREENSRMRDKYLCKVCMENQVRVTFMPCGHLACCGPCSMSMSECPVCRSDIIGCVRTYF